MSFKKWVMTFMITVGIICIMIGLFNSIVDPFGVFGDKVFNWYAYDMTNNPRVAKIAYLDQYHEDYDSYIIGCSKTSSYSTELLNEYFDASFYNLIMYGGDMYDIEKTALYVIDHYNVKNIVINIGLEEGVAYNTEADPIKTRLHAKVSKDSILQFYSEHLWMNPEYSIEKIKEYVKKGYLPNQYSVFTPETGAYNKSLRDSESIVDMADYIANNPGFNDTIHQEKMSSMDLAVGSIKRIKDYCAGEDITFKLITSPVSEKEVDRYTKDDLVQFWEKIAEVTDFWDFSGYSPVSYDIRYFYDTFHFRNSVGDMVLASIFDDASRYVPKDFGQLTTKQNVKEHAEAIFTPSDTIDTDIYTKDVPILMYHHIDEDENKGNASTINPDKFKEDMLLLKENGYTTIFFKDLNDYVLKGKELPDNPIVITFDDGYESNYIYAYPILKELDMKATISVIGISVGKRTYKATDHPIIPHFSYEEGKEMVDSGVIDIQSHSYNMHDNQTLDGDAYREGVLPKLNETEEDYIQLFIEDYGLSKSLIENNIGNDVFVYVYPYGKSNDLTEVLLSQMDNEISVTTIEGVNTVVKGLPQSLRRMKRINVPNTLTSERLIETLEKYLKKGGE